MLGLKDHEFAISESNVDGLYRLMCKLEDHEVVYSLDEEKESVNLSIKNFFSHYNLIETLLITDTVNELLRTGDWREREIPVIKDGFIHIQDKFYINPFTGDWKDRYASGGIVDLLSHYGESNRNRNIYRYDTLRDLLTWGTVEKNIINSILSSPNKIKKFFIELFYMTCKAKFNGEDYISEYKNFTQEPTFPRSVPWIDHETESSGIWLGNLRYYKNLSSPCFPGFEIIFEDVEPEYATLYDSIEKIGGLIVATLDGKFKYELSTVSICTLKFTDPSRGDEFRHLQRDWWRGCDEISHPIYQKLSKEEQELIKKGLMGMVKRGFISPPNPMISWTQEESNDWLSNKLIGWD